MAHHCLPVATVAQASRHDNSNNHTSTATLASYFTPNVSTDKLQIDLDHGQDSLSKVPNPPPPSPRRSAAVASVPQRSPVSRNVHVARRVARVPPVFVIDEASATKGIENMENSAWGMFSKWPLNAFLKLVGGGRDPEPEEPAHQVKDVPKSTEEEEVPPPYDSTQTISLGDNKITTPLSEDPVDYLSR